MKDVTPIATIEMEDGGKIVLELNPEQAPNTVANFIALANSGFYDGLVFHRIVPNFMIQGGDPDGNGTGGPGYGIKGEFSDNGHDNTIKHEAGAISMARSANPDSAGSQFFICDADALFLDGQYAAFGHVTEGLDLVKEIAQDPASREMAIEPRVIKSITVDTSGVEWDKPVTIGEN